MDSVKESPLSSRKHLLSERVPSKREHGLIDMASIDRSQEIVNELRREIEAILNNNGTKAQGSLRVLDLLEFLQVSLAQSVKGKE